MARGVAYNPKVGANTRPGRLLALSDQELTRRGVDLTSDKAEEFRRFQWGSQVTSSDFQAHGIQGADFSLVDDEPGRLDRQAPSEDNFGGAPTAMEQAAQDRMNMAGVDGQRPDAPFVDPEPGRLDRQAPSGVPGEYNPGPQAEAEVAGVESRRNGSGGPTTLMTKASGLLAKKKKTLLGGTLG